jgi:hypothetical protein
MTAPGYSERRSGLVKQIGLGRGRTTSREGPERSHPKPRRQRNRGLRDEEGREQRRPDRAKIRSGQTTLITIQ